MEGRGSLIAAILIVVLIIAVILGTVLYLTKSLGKINLLSKRPTVTTTQVASPRPNPTVGNSVTIIQSKTPAPTQNSKPNTPAPVSTPTPKPAQVPTPIPVSNNQNNSLTYEGSGFKLTYPSNWGNLICTTSSNFEFDPNNPGKQTQPCDYAVKPVTFLVNQDLNCQGDQVKIGNYQVTKSRLEGVLINGQQYDIVYNWCFSANSKNFHVSQRVSKNGLTASSKNDYSSQVEQIISSIH